MGRYRGNGVHAFWCTSQRNFGDLITPALLKHHGFTPILSSPKKSQIAGAGSIIEMLGNDFDGIIYGSGLLRKNYKLRLTKAKVTAVRGRLTRDLIGAPKNTTLGDPGLLISDLLEKRQKKKYRLGFVPHYHDLADYRLHILRKRYPGEICLINVLRSPMSVAIEIDRCEHVISSSLHGVVVADALGIPNRWAVLSERVLGHGYKFRDYYSAMGVTRNPISIGGEEELEKLIDFVYTTPKCVSDLKTGLRRQFEKVKNML